LGRSVHNIKLNTEALIFAGKEIGLEVNADKTKYMAVSPEQIARRNQDIKIDNCFFEREEKFKIFGNKSNK
jgi:hypothetical protein